MEKTNIIFNILFIFILPFFIASCGNANYEVYEDWDIDHDNRISVSEFYDGVVATRYFDSWNSDNDDYLSAPELYKGYYQIWDLDNDGAIDSVEWNKARDIYYDDYDNNAYGRFSDWNADDDNRITLEEFSEAIADTDFFSALDVDGNNLIDENEFAEGVHTYWDLDDSGYIEDIEYHEWYPIYWGV